MRLKAYAKVNLGLRVLDRRPDGYHNIESIFLPIDFFDEIEIGNVGAVGKLSPRIQFTSSAAPYGRENLCVQAAEAFFDSSGINASVEIGLKKQIWMGAGLGGGSSCAGCVLTGMNRLFGDPLTQKELFDVGLKIGSDVPFFVGEGPAVVEGRGEVVTRLPSLPGQVWFALVNPGFSISTKWAYDNMRNYLTRDGWDFTVLKSCFTKGDLRDLAQNLRNDFEELLFREFPKLEEIKEKLLELGAWGASISGSGSCVYGVFEKSDETLEDAFPGCEVRTASSRVV